VGRIRTIKPEFTQDEELSALSAETHLLSAGLLCYADDFGYFNANPGLVKAAVFPLRETSRKIPEMIGELVGIGYLRLGTATDGKRFGHIVNFSKHQRVSHPTDSKISCLGITWDDSGDIPEDSGDLTSHSALNREQGTGNRNVEREQESLSSPSAIPDSIPASSWEEFVEHRRTGKKKFSLRAQQLAIKTLLELERQGNDPQAVIEQSIRNDWKDLYPIKTHGVANGSKSSSRNAERSASIGSSLEQFTRSRGLDRGPVGAPGGIPSDIDQHRDNGALQLRAGPVRA
jgi:hypothetical protein